MTGDQHTVGLASDRPRLLSSLPQVFWDSLPLLLPDGGQPPAPAGQDERGQAAAGGASTGPAGASNGGSQRSIRNTATAAFLRSRRAEGAFGWGLAALTEMDTTLTPHFADPLYSKTE